MRKGELLFNYAVALGPLVIGLSAVWAMGLASTVPKIAFWSMVALFLLGFALFVTAKISVITQGHRFTCGPSKMSRVHRTAYFLGYGGMIVGLFLLIGFALAAR